MNKKAVALLSGGLDSTLAVKTMIDQGVEVIALNFTSPFCNCTKKDSGCDHEASRVAKEFGIEIKVISKGIDYINNVVRNPKHGYGKHMNPCIDCRIFMHKAAKKVMEETGASFIITGEVLGQRPMSQRRDTLDIIERESDLKGQVVRPLSAKLFTPTIPEQKGLIDRDGLLSIQGRSRKEQMELAEEKGINDYPCASGGCKLTDENFAKKIKDLFVHKEEITLKDIHLLNVGRHFRLDKDTKLIIGRNEHENKRLEYTAQPGDYLFIPDNFPAPAGILCGEISDDKEAFICKA
ncbi:MAG: 7-cyano-7-deazaguanine synthase, partial [Nitrospirota bacterium]